MTDPTELYSMMNASVPDILHLFTSVYLSCHLILAMWRRQHMWTDHDYVRDDDRWYDSQPYSRVAMTTAYRPAIDQVSCDVIINLDYNGLMIMSHGKDISVYLYCSLMNPGFVWIFTMVKDGVEETNATWSFWKEVSDGLGREFFPWLHLPHYHLVLGWNPLSICMTVCWHSGSWLYFGE